MRSYQGTVRCVHKRGKHECILYPANLIMISPHTSCTQQLWEVIDRSWLRLFNEPELQVLISGASDGKIDVSDMKSNARYTGGYSMVDRNIIRFWSCVSSFTPKQQADLLRFVTSCERPPPLGFASMNPPFTIQRVGIMRDGEKLPTASTCFNTLKLPTYSRCVSKMVWLTIDVVYYLLIDPFSL